MALIRCAVTLLACVHGAASFGELAPTRPARHSFLRRSGEKTRLAFSEFARNGTTAALQHESVAEDDFADCSSQSPSSKAWWMTAVKDHKQVDDVGSLKGSNVYRLPKTEVVVCVPPKNGCTYWKSLVMRMQGNPFWNQGGWHKNLYGGLSPDVRALGDPSARAIMLVRNPIARLLSAYIEKCRSDGYSSNVHKMLPFTENGKPTKRGFARFLSAYSQSIRDGSADVHWRRQVDHCGINHGARWDMHLKVECRTQWGASMFKAYNMTQWTDSGWGDNQRQPFIPANGDGDAKVTKIPNFDKHNSRTNELGDVCKWYDEETFLQAVRLYKSDVVKFGYTKEVEHFAKECGWWKGFKKLFEL